MSIGRRRRRRFADKPNYPASAFGGWGDYRTWAEHQFLPKPVEEEPEEARDVEVDDGAREDDARDVETGDGAWEDDARDTEEAVAGEEGAYGDPGRSWADADEHHHVESTPDVVPRAGPAPATDLDPDWAPPYPARYGRENSRPVGPRPYVLSRGRTRGDTPLRMDTLISVTPQGALSVDDPALSSEYRWICDICREPMAVVEIAGRLRMPIGVTIVLIGDAIGWNLLRMHPVTEADNQPSLGIITRVHEGLRRLP